MMLKHSMFYDVFFPKEDLWNEGSQNQEPEILALRRQIGFRPKTTLKLDQIAYVVFDIETTGLDAERDAIIEIGAQKYKNGELIGEMSSFIACPFPIPEAATRISGITDNMLEGAPDIRIVLKEFLNFMKGSLLVAHNASFDTGFVSRALSRAGYDWDWPIFCTLKMARELLPKLERKNLDTLAAHYGLSFEARHRSIGDVKVTAAVLWKLFETGETPFETWGDLAPYRVPVVS
jgi:DNA polymerase-3 subunit epsilon